MRRREVALAALAALTLLTLPVHSARESASRAGAGDAVYVSQHLHAKGEVAAAAAVDAATAAAGKAHAAADAGTDAASAAAAAAAASAAASTATSAAGGAAVDVDVTALVQQQAAAAQDAADAAEAKLPNDVVFGRTPSGRTPWRSCGSRCVWTTVDARVAGFTKTPTYVCTLQGNGWHDLAWGGCTVFRPHKDGFHVVVRTPHGRNMNPGAANSLRWVVNWAATTNPTFGGSTPSGSSNWRPYSCHWGHRGCHGIYMDTSIARQRLRGQVNIVTSITCQHGCESTLGGSSVYNPNSNGFRTYIYTGFHLDINWARSNAKYAVNWIATTGNRQQSFQSGRNNRYGWRTNWWLNQNFGTGSKKLPDNAVWLTSLSGSSSHWTARGTAAIWRTNGAGGLNVIAYTCGNGCARRYNWQTNFIGGRPYADLILAEIRTLTQTARVLARSSGALASETSKRSRETSQLQASVSALTRQLSSGRSREGTTAQDLQQLANKRRQLRHSIQQLVSKAAALRAVLTRSSSALRSQALQLKGDVAAESQTLKGLTDNVEAGTAQLSRLVTSAARVNTALGAVSSSISLARAAAQTAASTLATRTAQLKASETSAKESNAAEKRRFAEVSKQAEDLRSATAAATKERTSTHADMQRLIRKIEHGKVALQSMYAETRTGRQDIDALRRTATAQAEQHRKVLEEEGVEIPQLTQDARLLNDEAAREEAKYKDEAGQLAALQAELKRNRQDVAAKLARFRRTKHQLDLQVTVMQRFSDDEAKDVEQRKERLTATRQAAEDLEGRRDREQQHVQKLREREAALVGGLHELHAKMAMAQEDSAHLFAAVDSMESHVRRMRGDLVVASAAQQSLSTRPQVMQVLEATPVSPGLAASSASSSRRKI